MKNIFNIVIEIFKSFIRLIESGFTEFEYVLNKMLGHTYPKAGI